MFAILLLLVTLNHFSANAYNNYLRKPQPASKVNNVTTTTLRVPIVQDHLLEDDHDNKIPLDFVQKIADYSVSDLLLHYIDDYDEDFSLANRFGEDIERSSAITPKNAVCMPELQVVELVNNTDPSVLYIPTCTRLERCGGCCSHNLLTCQPTETEIVSFKVIKTQFSAGRLKFVDKIVVHIEKHTKCTCGCKIQKEDCNASQEYKRNECRCVCSNKDEENKCHYGTSLKLWDPVNCVCRCRQITECSTGYTFDTNMCKCLPVLIHRRYAESSKDVEQQRRAKNLSNDDE